MLNQLLDAWRRWRARPVVTRIDPLTLEQIPEG